MNQPISNIVIVGGGTAGWMSAALLSKVFGKSRDIALIESDEIGSVGVGEATIPPIQLFNQLLGINESDFLKATGGTIKLGIQFENWGDIGESYMHAFGNVGRDLGFTHFHHYWLRANKHGYGGSFWDYSFNYLAAKNNLFSKLPQIPNSPLQGLVYAYHFDAGLYAKFLRTLSESQGVKRIEGKIQNVHQNSDNGFITSVELESGKQIEGDLFLDCSGMRGLLIEQTLQTGFESSSDWLFCDRAVALPCQNHGAPIPYTRSIAHSFGWQWPIPLQHRTGNGMVYSSDLVSDDEALHCLKQNLDGDLLAEPNFIRFNIGRRNKAWHKNVIAIGLSSGFLEPLESTSIHLIQQSITRLIKLFPFDGIVASEVNEYNRQTQYEFERIRDFIILHYHLNRRNDSELWKKSRDMSVPDSLRNKMELFRETGKFFREPDELFSEVAWHQVFLGQGMVPSRYHPLADSISESQLKEFLMNLTIIMKNGLNHLTSHHDFLKSHQFNVN